MTHTMSGKICLVTGATDGIGKAAAHGLARLGATVVVLGRNPQKSAAVVEELKRASGNPNVEALLCDLSSQQSIRDAAAEFRRRHDRLHVLINQAGVYLDHRTRTVDGLETMFAVNHLAYFQLTVLLLDLLVASAPSRVIIGTGLIERIAKIRFDDLQGERSFRPLRQLAQAKLGNLLFAAELKRRLEGKDVAVLSFFPGAVKTTLGQGQGGAMGLIMRFARRFGATPEQAGAIAVRLASAPELQEASGTFFNVNTPAKPSKRSRDPALGKQFWDVCAQLTGL